MAGPDRPVYRVIFLVVLAPIGAAVIVGTLLLFGASPRLVFFAGHLVRSWFQLPKAAGVLTTVFFWWIVIVAIGLLWERRRRSRGI